MRLEIEDELLTGLVLSPEEARIDFAVGLFVDQRVTLARAARIARLPQAEFQQLLGRRGIPIHYGLEDWQVDLRSLDELKI